MTTQTRFTPGPLGPPNDHRKAKVIRIRAVDQERLGFSIAFSDARTDAERVEYAANAALIAAAPRLYAELDHLVTLLEPMERDGSINVPGLATLNGARAALAQARGEP